MIATRRGAALALLLAVTAPSAGPVRAVAAAPGPPVTAAEGRPRPALVVAVVVDQLAAWVAAERLPLLGGGGFARLRREGTWVKDMAYLHAVTETAPGHAALFTGTTPRENGIHGNTVLRPELRDPECRPRPASLLDDPLHHLLGPAGALPGDGVSLARLRQPTLADQLLQRDPAAVVVALSLKDRGAAFGGGRSPSASLWYDEHHGVLVTSTAFAAALPDWALPLAHPIPAQGARWAPLDARFLRDHAATPDDQPGESTLLGGRTFDHLVPPPPQGASAFRATPFADAFLLDLAIAAATHARRPGHPMLLAVSLSSNDYVGHLFGPDSWEAWDELARLDAALGRFLARLDELVGPEGWALVLSGDHGIVPLPEVQGRHPDPACAAGGAEVDPYQRPCREPGLRIDQGALRRSLEAAAASTPGAPRPGPVIARVVESVVHLTDAARALPPEARRRLDDSIVRAARAVPGVADAFPLEPMRAGCPPATDESPRALVCRSVLADGDGDYYLVSRPGSFFGHGAAGTTHGSPWRYDRTVPLLVRYPGAPGGAEVARGTFGSFRASAWYALTGERLDGPYGGVIGAGR